MNPLAPLLLAAAMGQSAPASPPPTTADAPPPSGRDLEAPPPQASAEEQALWRRAYETNNRTLTVRSTASRLQLRAKVALDQLESLAKAERLPGERVRHLEHEVKEAWTASLALMGRQWPVDPTRSCRYDHLYYDSALQLAPGARRAAEVQSTRASLEECLRRAESVLRKADASNRELEEEVSAAERAIGEAAPVKAAGT